MTVPPGLTHVGRLELTYDEALLYETHAGARGFSQAISGSLTGPRVTGKLADDGGDWLTFRSDGVIDTDSRVMIETGDGALFFSSSETSEVRVGAGLVRQGSGIRFQVLQGKIESIRMKVEGNGEVLSVSGEQVLGWKLVDGGTIEASAAEEPTTCKMERP